VAKILEQRREATEGVRELARRAFEAADRKNSEFEHALQIARAELHQEHEALRRQWSDEQAEIIAQARAEADQKIQIARQQIALEVERAEAELEARVDRLSEQIVQSLTARRAA
jgi:F0F1-type ATP synthase membrane subunit b/b'